MGITLIGVLEIVAGFLGTAVFVSGVLLWGSTALGLRMATAGDFGLVPMVVLFWPAPLVLWAGLGVVRRQAWALTVNRVWIPAALTVLALFMVGFHVVGFIETLSNLHDLEGGSVQARMEEAHAARYIGDLVTGVLLALLLIAPVRWFFGRPSIREEFRRQTAPDAHPH